MASFKCRAGDVGVQLRRQVRRADGTVVDLTAGQSARFLLTKPNGTTVVEKAATFESPRTDGWITWTSTQETDFDVAGDWLETFEVTMSDGKSWQSVESRVLEVAERVAVAP